MRQADRLPRARRQNWFEGERAESLLLALGVGIVLVGGTVRRLAPALKALAVAAGLGFVVLVLLPAVRAPASADSRTRDRADATSAGLATVPLAATPAPPRGPGGSLARADTFALAPAPPSDRLATVVAHGGVAGLALSDATWTARVEVLHEPLAALPGTWASFASQAPDGSKVTLAARRDGLGGDQQLLVASVAGGALTEIARLPGDLWPVTPVWSPDSLRFAYLRAPRGAPAPGLELWVASADGQEDRLLVADPSLRPEIFYGDNRAPLRWTPDGTAVQYLDDKDLPPRVYEASLGGRLRWAPVSASSLGSPVGGPALPGMALSQNAPAWRSTDVPGCHADFGTGGAPLVAAAMALRGQGVAVDPPTLARSLGEAACPLRWQAIPAAVSATPLTVQVLAFDWGRLGDELARRRPVILWLSDTGDWRSVRLSHFVVALAGAGQSSSAYRIADPWDGTTYKTLDWYTARGYRPLQMVLLAPS